MEDLDVAMVMVGVFFFQLQTQRGGNKALFSWSYPVLSSLGWGRRRAASQPWEGLDAQGCDCTCLCFQFLPGAAGF